MKPVHLRQNESHLIAGEDNRETLRFLGVDGFDRAEILVQNFAVEEKEGGERLPSTGSGQGF